MRSPVELVILDCDGVLVDTEPMAARLFADMVGEVSPAMTDEQRAQLLSLPTRFYFELVTQVEQKFGYRLPANFTNLYRARLMAKIEAGVAPIPGAVDALDNIFVPTCVASGSATDRLRLTLAQAGLLSRFEGRLFSTEMVAHGKPHPDIFIYAAKQMRADPARCVVVEDSRVGVHAARAAGMAVLGYAGRTDGAALREAGAYPFFDMAQLPNLTSRDPATWWKQPIGGSSDGFSYDS